MNSTAPLNNDTSNAISAPFFVKGELLESRDSVQRSRDLGVNFATPI